MAVASRPLPLRPLRREELCSGVLDINQWEFCPLAPVDCPQWGLRLFPGPAAAAASAPLPSGSQDPFG